MSIEQEMHEMRQAGRIAELESLLEVTESRNLDLEREGRDMEAAAAEMRDLLRRIKQLPPLEYEINTDQYHCYYCLHLDSRGHETGCVIGEINKVLEDTP